MGDREVAERPYPDAVIEPKWSSIEVLTEFTYGVQMQLRWRVSNFLTKLKARSGSYNDVIRFESNVSVLLSYGYPVSMLYRLEEDMDAVYLPVSKLMYITEVNWGIRKVGNSYAKLDKHVSRSAFNTVVITGEKVAPYLDMLQLDSDKARDLDMDSFGDISISQVDLNHASRLDLFLDELALKQYQVYVTESVYSFLRKLDFHDELVKSKSK